ncbi:MAG: NEAT domain-containing protein [Terrisporobacter sp.]
MIRKGKFLKNMAVALAIVSIFGSTLSSVSAMEISKNATAILQYVDGTYKLNTILKHESKDESSIAHTYLKSSKLEVYNNKIYMVMTFKNGSMLKEVKPSVNNLSVESSNTLDTTSDERTIRFEIKSTKDDIKLNLLINPFGDMKVNATCRVINDEVDIPTTDDEEDTETPPATDEEDKEDTVTPPATDEDDEEDTATPPTTDEDDSNSGSSNNGSSTYKNGYYQVKNILHIDNPVGYNMVRNLLSETTNMEVKNGKTYITLRMSSYSLMSNINIKVNNKSTNFTKTKLDNDTVEFRVEVPNVNAKLKFSMFVSAMGKNTDFEVTFNKSSVKFISSNEEPTIPGSNNNNNNSSNNNSPNNNSSNNNSSSSDDKVVSGAVKGKLYTIKNQVISNSQTGREMARKYLNSSTKIEEIDGKMYATLTFSGVDLMNNHKIYVNGSLVNHSVTSKTSSNISIRFAIPDVNADIKVQVHVIPMNNTVKFGVKLLEDTLTFVKDFEVENGKLPQTGGLINSEIMLAGGSLLIMSGVLLRRKRK